jgi:hypothetical protein
MRWQKVKSWRQDQGKITKMTALKVQESQKGGAVSERLPW